MSDKEIKLDIQPQKRRVWRIVLFAIAALLVLGGVFVYVFRDRLPLDALRRELRYSAGDDTKQTVYSFDENNSNLYAPFGTGLAVVSNSGVTTFRKDGKQISVAQAQMTTPAVCGGEKLLLVFDAGGNRLYAATPKKGTVLDLTTEKPILDADLSEDGYICYAGSETGYKSVLNVYNDKQELVYRWLSASQFMPLCTVSEKGTYLAAETLGQNRAMFECSVTVFNTASSEEAQTVIPTGNELLYDLRFMNGDTICTVGESSAGWFRLDGSCVGRYDYSDSYLKDFSMEGNGFLTLVLNMFQAGSRSSVVTLDETGAELGRVGVEGQILDLAVNGDYAAVLTADMLTVYDKTLTPVSRLENNSGITHIILHKDGSAVLLSGGRGELYLP